MTRLQSLSAHALMAAVVFAILDPAAAGAQAKRVVCIDGKGDGYLTAYEGYLRANPGAKPNDIQIGNNAADLTTCLSKVVKGDNLFIIAHAAEVGTRKGGAFEWGGVTYSGFAPPAGAGGTGVPGAPPFRVPGTYAGLTQITVTIGSCHSSKDPDDAGPEKPVTTSLKNCLNTGANNRNTVTGYDKVLNTPILYKVERATGTEEERKRAERDLKANQMWMKNPPTNRPNAGTTHQTAAQAQADALVGAGKVTVTITGYGEPYVKAELVLDTHLESAAGINTDCGAAVPIALGAVPGLSGWSLAALWGWLLAAGVWLLARRRPHNARA